MPHKAFLYSPNSFNNISMELNSILKFLENRRILVTGATGFLAKVFIEKVLRVQPGAKKLYLLLRAPDDESALRRFRTEVMGKELFVVVKEKYGPAFESFIHEKTSVMAGDIAVDHCLGIKGVSTLKELYEHLEIVVNLAAATTDFDERFDISLGINTVGAANVLSFSKKCRKLKVFLHVSTAYLCGEEEGVILEKPLKFGETLNGTPQFEIDKEIAYAEDALKQLYTDKDTASQKQITSVMKNLGIQRARKYGWSNTYSFTKAMGEMLLGHLKGDLPLVIIRPTIITSTYKEPFPGWLEGIKHIDSFVVGYGKGKMPCFPGDPQTIIDLIPADMVVNAMIVSMAAHADEPTEMICHVGSSMENPVLYRHLQEYALRFFTEQPWIDRDGKLVVVRKATELSTKDSVRRYLQMHYSIPLKILGFVNAASCGYFRGMYIDLARRVEFLRKLVELFEPYMFFKGVFDDINTERLRRAVDGKCGADEAEIFYFDPKSIRWDEYFMYTHVAGVVKYAGKTRKRLRGYIC